MSDANIASRIFDGTLAQCKIEELLADAGLEVKRLGWDHYDNSLELHGIAPEIRLSEAVQKIIADAGFSKVYVNHTDKWETHYSWGLRGGAFKPHDGWRVSYPHKRNDDEKAILVEKIVDGWPKEWFETGYCKVKP